MKGLKWIPTGVDMQKSGTNSANLNLKLKFFFKCLKNHQTSEGEAKYNAIYYTEII